MVTIISIHAPHTGRDHGLQRQLLRQEGFQSTRPIRGATPFLYTLPLPRLYFNPRAPYGARLIAGNRFTVFSSISIHAPHTGRDILYRVLCLRHPISIHAPHTGRDTEFFINIKSLRISIHAPHTGRDSSMRAGDSGPGYFNPRAPYGARHYQVQGRQQRVYISIHAPHTGRDKQLCDLVPPEKKFQSTRPIRGATHSRHNIKSS